MTPLFPDLTAWVEARGGDLSGVQIRDAATIPPARPGASVRRGRGLFATRAVRAGETIFSIPLSALITERVARASAVGAAVTSYAAAAGFTCPPRILLALYVMMERHDRGNTGGEYAARTVSADPWLWAPPQAT